MKGKRGFEIEALGWWILAIAILIIFIIGWIILKDKNLGMIEYLKNLFRLGK